MRVVEGGRGKHQRTLEQVDHTCGLLWRIHQQWQRYVSSEGHPCVLLPAVEERGGVMGAVLWWLSGMCEPTYCFP